MQGNIFIFLTGVGCDTTPRVEGGRESVLMKGACSTLVCSDLNGRFQVRLGLGMTL